MPRSQLNETADDFNIGITRTNIENTGEVDKGHESLISYNSNYSTAKSGYLVDMQTLENNIADTITIKVEKVNATVKTRVHEVILSALEILFVPRMELAMRSVGVFSAHNPSSVVLDPNKRDF